MKKLLLLFIPLLLICGCESNSNIENKEIKRERVAQPTAVNHQDTSLGAKPVEKKDKVGRNDNCPCGSGKKYKACCGKFE